MATVDFGEVPVKPESQNLPVGRVGGISASANTSAIAGPITGVRGGMEWTPTRSCCGKGASKGKGYTNLVMELFVSSGGDPPSASAGATTSSATASACAGPVIGVRGSMDTHSQGPRPTPTGVRRGTCLGHKLTATVGIKFWSEF